MLNSEVLALQLQDTSNPLDENFGDCNTASTVVALGELAALL